MSLARGIKAIIGMYDETTYATDPSAPDATKLYFTKFNPGYKQELIDDPTITGLRTNAKPAFGNIDLSPSLESVIAPEWIGKPLKHLFGAVADSGAGPYSHLFTIGDLPTSFMLERDYGSAISGSGRYEKLNGCRIEKATFKFPVKGWCTMALAMKGAKIVQAASPLDATYTDLGHSGFTSFSGTIEEDGAPIAVVAEAEMTLANDLDPDVYVIGGLGVRRSLSEGFALLGGSITALFESQALLNKAIANTVTSLKITLSRGDGLGSAGNESIVWLSNQLLLEPNVPPVEGPRGLRQTFPIKPYRLVADLGLQLTLNNAIATV
jgi:hypothetical protein